MISIIKENNVCVCFTWLMAIFPEYCDKKMVIVFNK